MIKMIPLKCTNCHATMEVSEGNEFYFCNYCGEKIMIYDTNVKTIRKTIRKEYHDDAKVLRAENARRIIEFEHEENMRKQECQLKSEQSKNGLLQCALMISFLFIAIGIMVPASMSFFEEDAYSKEFSYINPPYTNDNLKGKAYQEVAKAFKYAGFSDVQTVSENDIIMGILKKDGEVDSVFINGCDDFNKYDFIKPDAEIVIYYHSKRK